MTDIVLGVSLHELCQCEGLTEQLIIEVVDHGIAQPVAGNNVVDWVFDTSSVHWLQKAVRLHYDLEIDWISGLKKGRYESQKYRFGHRGHFRLNRLRWTLSNNSKRSEQCVSSWRFFYF